MVGGKNFIFLGILLSLKENKGRKRGDWYLKQVSTDLKHGSKMDMEK